jgi:hypothetical protein
VLFAVETEDGSITEKGHLAYVLGEDLCLIEVDQEASDDSNPPEGTVPTSNHRDITVSGAEAYS